MGVPTSEIGYTSAMPRREDHEVHKKDMWWHWGGESYERGQNVTGASAMGDSGFCITSAHLPSKKNRGKESNWEH